MNIFCRRSVELLKDKASGA